MAFARTCKINLFSSCLLNHVRFIFDRFFRSLHLDRMEPSATIPAASSGRLLKSESGKGRSLSEDRIKFVEEEYDVPAICDLLVAVSLC